MFYKLQKEVLYGKEKIDKSMIFKRVNDSNHTYVYLKEYDMDTQSFKEDGKKLVVPMSQFLKALEQHAFQYNEDLTKMIH